MKRAKSKSSEPDFGIGFAEIPLAILVPNDYNARRFEENMTAQRLVRFNELVESIREKKILEPLLVRPIAGGHFEVIAGERRYRAALVVAQSEKVTRADYLVPCMVRDVDDDEAFDIMVIENLQREDLTPFETARAFQLYLEKHGNTPDAAADLAARTGLPVHAIRRQLRLLALPAPVLAAWKEESITQSHAELFTRLADEAQVLELLATCQRGRLSTRELAARIGAIAPDLDKGFFDKEECQTCHYNTSVQSGLFADAGPGGKCGNAGCFEQKQGAFLAENWARSKAAEKFGSRGFRFSHRLEPLHRTLAAEATAERCLGCAAFVSVLRLTGAVVGGYERTCTGPAVCFEELYRSPSTALDDAPIKDVNGCGRGRETCPAAGSTCPDCLDPGPATDPADLAAAEKQPENLGDSLRASREKSKPAASSKTTAPPEETGPVFSASRGEKFRQAFIKEVLPDIVNREPIFRPDCQRLVLTALALSSVAVRTHLIAGMGLSSNVKADQLAAKIFEVPREEINSQVIGAALAWLLNDFTLMPAVRQLVAEKFAAEVARDWRLTEEYLQSLTKSEIIRVGEEPGVRIWTDEAVEAYRRQHHKGKALRSLGKGELVDCILKSGADLAGRVPAEVLGRPLK